MWNPFHFTAALAQERSVGLLEWAMASGWPSLDVHIGWASAVAGHIHMLEWMLEKKREIPARAWDAAAYGGHIRVMIWLRRQDIAMPESVWKGAIQCEDKLRRVEVLEWLREHVGVLPVEVNITKELAERDHDKTLRDWFNSHGLRIAKTGNNSRLRFMSSIADPFPSFTFAARRGDIRTLQHLKDTEGWLGACKISAMCGAAEGGQVQVLEWIKSLGPAENEQQSPPHRVLSQGVSKGHLNVVQWCLDNGFSFTPGLCNAAAASGHLGMLKWLAEKGCPMELDDIAQRALSGQIALVAGLNSMPSDAAWKPQPITGGQYLDILLWLRDQGHSFSNRVVVSALSMKSSTTMKAHVEWLRAHGCCWDESTFDAAVYSWDIPKASLEWLRATDCPRVGMDETVSRVLNRARTKLP